MRGSAWQRSCLGYKERFVDDFEFNGIRVRQFPSRSVFEKAVSDTIGANVLDASDDEADNDRVPDTAFTVWDASVLLGIYASRKDVWSRLTKRKAPPNCSRPMVTLELGAGTGVASLLFATSEVVRETKYAYNTMMTDLQSAINFTRLNVHANIHNIPNNVTITTQPLRWGRVDDMDALLRDIGHPDILFGADLLYTCDKSVISALAETVIMLTGRVAVFAVCKMHRPESIHFFISLVECNFDVRHIPASSVSMDLLASDDDFAVLELWRRKSRIT
jgi:hypothetical protein